MTRTVTKAERAMPRHVAIIMDGNGRWARQRGLPRTVGHKRGADAVRRAVEGAAERGIECLTLFGFSAENWGRPADEVAELMRLLRTYLQSEIAELHRNGVRLTVIGERDRLPADVRDLVARAEALTAENRRLHLTIALSYGARQELVTAVRTIAEAAQRGALDPADITAETIRAHLYDPDLPDPDLVIRTSGEKRVSNFLLWQIAYAELVFLTCDWPEFTAEDLDRAIDEYRHRDRRYGVIAGGV